MSDNTLGTVIESLCETIKGRRSADPETSYTAFLLSAHEDKVLKKIAEEAGETLLAAKDIVAERTAGVASTTEHGSAHDHLIYETCDLLYHTLVLCEKFDITPDELATELHRRFK